MVKHLQPICINLKSTKKIREELKKLMNYEEKMIPIYEHEIYIDKIKLKILKVNQLKQHILNEDWSSAIAVLNHDIRKLDEKQDEMKSQAKKIIKQVQPNYTSSTIDD
tara:strand:- start:201 stop:524 length:324 start_codon:yes stop_codon:yes gene_type:complete